LPAVFLPRTSHLNPSQVSGDWAGDAAAPAHRGGVGAPQVLHRHRLHLLVLHLP
ncbi:hypothetical protein CFC21_023568, partial [Triticum aestivum]